MTTGDSDGEILLADQVTWLPLNLVQARDQNGNPIPGAPRTFQEALASSDEDIEVSDRLVPVNAEDWSGGMGVSYHEAPGLYTRTPGYACPAGAGTAITLPAPVSGSSDSPIVAIRQYGSDLFAAQTGNGAANTARVMRSTDGGTTWTNSLSLGANVYIRDLISYDNGAGVQCLYASSCTAKDPDPGADGALHRWNGTIWGSTTAGTTYGTYSRQRMATVFWVDQEGIGDWRLVVISGSKTISYTRPGADPFDVSGTAWIEGVRIRTAANLLRLAAARRHIYVTAADGVFDLDEQGNSPNLTNYTDTLIHGANGLAAQYLDNYVYTSLGQGLDRVYVGDAQVLQENIGQCAPGQLTRARTRWTHAWTTELHQDQGFVVNAVHNPTTLESGIFWGMPRAKLGIETRNPLVWYGPEVVITGGYKVTAMRSYAPSNDDLRFFVAAHKDATAPVMARVSLPISGAPIDDLISGGKHKFATGSAVTLGAGSIQGVSRLHTLDEAFGERASNKILYRHTVNAEGLSVVAGSDDGLGTKLVFQTRADPTPAQTSFTSSDNVTNSPTQTITPATVVQGNRLEFLISFISPQGGASVPKVGVLDAVRSLAWKIAPTVGVRTLDVEYGDTVLSHSNVSSDPRGPNWMTDRLVELTQVGRTTLRDRQDQRWTVKVRQSLPRDTTLHTGGDYGKTVKARLSLSVIAGPL